MSRRRWNWSVPSSRSSGGKFAFSWRPSDEVSGKELLEHFRRGLTDSERRVAELRSQGLAWADIAAALGGTAQARRMELARAIERVARDLGLDDAGFSLAPTNSPNRDS